jgi:hypothetical protein
MTLPIAARQHDAGRPDSFGRAILAILSLAMVGTLAELLLLEHYDGWRQWIPLTVLATTALVLMWQAFSPSVNSARVLRVLMWLLIVAGVAGVVLHVQGNLEFEAELNPGMTGWPLWLEVARGATPALAPGSLIPFGLLGLLYASRYRTLPSKES